MVGQAMTLMGGLSTKMLEVRYYQSQMISDKITTKQQTFLFRINEKIILQHRGLCEICSPGIFQQYQDYCIQEFLTV